MLSTVKQIHHHLLLLLILLVKRFMELQDPKQLKLAIKVIIHFYPSNKIAGGVIITSDSGASILPTIFD